MDTSDLRHGFWLGDWLVEPRELRITGPTGPLAVSQSQIDLLLILAERPGETVSRRNLSERLWPGQDGQDVLLDDAAYSLRELLSGSTQNRPYIVGVDGGSFMLVVQPGEAERAPAPQPAATTAIGQAAPVAKSLAALFLELKRRNVLRVMGTYAVGMWLVLQVAETTFEPLQLPGWWMTALTILAVVGLPIVFVLAWSYEITQGGIVLDQGVPGGFKLPRARRALAPALVAGVALMAAVTGYAWWLTLGGESAGSGQTHGFQPSPESIAVLPFVDMSPEGESAYLGDGLSEELSSDLARLPKLRVAARTSAFAFRGKDIDVRKIGEQLGVRYVLEGSVRRVGDRVRVTAQLIDAVSGFHAWTESYNRPWQDLIGIQTEISGAIARQLQTVLTPEIAQQLKAARTLDSQAYDFYLAGVSQLRQGGTARNIEQAENSFRRALAADPGFVRAQAGLCEAVISRYEHTNDVGLVPAAESACRAALEADPTLKETELALGKLYLASGRLEQSEAVYRSLVRRAPGDADVRIGLGRALARSNRTAEAEKSFREAILVEPGYWQAYNSLGNFLFNLGRSDEAAVAYARVTELAPGNATGFNNLGAARMTSGDLDGSAKAFEQSLAIEQSRGAYSNLGTVYYSVGRMEDAATMYTRATELAPEDFVTRGSLGDAHWFVPGGRDRALQDYRRAAALAEKALAVDTTSSETWYLLGYYYARLGENDRSIRYLKRAVDLAPDSPHASYFAAVAAAARGDKQEASRMINRALEQGYPRALAVSDPALRGVTIR
jgi:TolB-like protein/Flp pilus assembly protein TadD/DNA-binding winged helix-turn-helix (wHTH) protein